MADKTFFQLVSAIELNLANGLKSVTNVAFDKELIGFEIDFARGEVIAGKDAVTLSWNKNSLYQDLSCIELTCNDIASCGVDVNSGYTGWSFELPEIMQLQSGSVDFCGTPDRQENFRVYFNSNWSSQKYSMTSQLKPFVWINGNKGWLFNKPTKQMKWLFMRAIFQNPMELRNYSCVGEDFTYPIINGTWPIIEKNVMSRLLPYYYRQLNVQPNTQTDVVR